MFQDGARDGGGEVGSVWRSIDLEGEVEELEVGCPWTVTTGDAIDACPNDPGVKRRATWNVVLQNCT